MKLWEQLFCVKQHQLRMMRARGRSPPDAALVDYTFPQFEAYFTQAVAARAGTDIFDVLTTDADGVLVWYAPSQKRDIPIDDVRALVDYITDADARVRPYTEIIIVSFGRMNTKTSQMLDFLDGVFLQHFAYAELMYDPTQHFLAVPHTRLDPKAARALLAKHAIQPAQLPTLWTSDPIAKYYAFRPNDIVRIERTSLTSAAPHRSVFYRRVVNAPVSKGNESK